VRDSRYDDTCAEGLVCCSGAAAEEKKVNVKLGKVYYSSEKEAGAYSYDKACEEKTITKSSWLGLKKKTTKVAWDRTATFFVDIKDGAETKRGILKFCFEESEGGWEKGKTRVQ